MSKKYINFLIYISFICLIVTSILGLIMLLSYTSPFYLIIKNTNFNMQKIKPLHTIYAFAWIFLCSIAIISYNIYENNVEKKQKIIKHIINIWIINGLIITISILLENYSGIEYIEYKNVLATPILISWIFFFFIFLKINKKKIWEKPIYIYMWLIGMLLFIISYTELIIISFKKIELFPIFSIQIQWKAIGSITASFNSLIYGILYYINEKINKENKYSYSNVAYFFFTISTLNSLTNFTHHTYHFPQSIIAKYIGFFVSMLEIFILIKIVHDIKKTILYFSNNRNTINAFLLHIQIWMIFNLFIAIIISIPPINTIIHGTYVVLSHSMGSMISIDTLILLTAVYCIKNKNRIDTKNKKIDNLLNIFTFFLSIFIIGLLISGFIIGIKNIQNEIIKEPIKNIITSILIISGIGIFYSINNLIYKIMK